MDLSGDTPVTLIIKAPNQRMADHTVDCMLGWTIKKLKQHLEAVYPSKPKHNEQRLIYSGRLLQDHLTLKEILRQYDSTFSSKHTVHLVCSSLSDSSPSSSAMSIPSQNASADVASQLTASSPVGNPPGSSDHIQTNSMGAEGVRYRGARDQAFKQSTNPEPTSAYASHQTGAAEADMATGYTGYPYSAEQYAWMMQHQQMYSQFMMQYMQYYQNMVNPSQSFNPMISSAHFMQQSPATNPVPQQQPQVLEAAAANNAPPLAGRPNVRMNAQGGVEEDDEEGEPRDWLHHAYFFMRFLTFMAILFFYSMIGANPFLRMVKLQRFRNYLQRTYREQEQQQQNNQQQNNQQQPVQEGNEQPEVRHVEAQEGVPQPESGVQNDQQQQNVGENVGQTTRIFVFICNTIQAFFTSLIPAPPELLQPN